MQWTAQFLQEELFSAKTLEIFVPAFQVLVELPGISQWTNLTNLSDLREINYNFKNNYNLEFECNGNLIFSVLARL